MNKLLCSLRSSCLGLCLLLPVTALAQDETADTDAAKEEQAETTQTEPEPAPPQPEAGSPFEYEASEQISEDLSVSFPVDI